MAIQACCSGCKATFNVKDQMAGKKVRCPKCKGVIAVPGAGQPQRTVEVGKRPAAKPLASPSTSRSSSSRRASLESRDTDVLLRKPTGAGQGRKGTVVTAKTCPSCGKALVDKAISCSACGFNIRLGRRMSITAAIEKANLPKGVRSDGSTYVPRSQKAEERVELGRKVQLGMYIGIAVFVLIVAGVLAYVALKAPMGRELDELAATVLPGKMMESGAILQAGRFFHPYCVNKKVSFTINKTLVRIRKTPAVALEGTDALARAAQMAQRLQLPRYVRDGLPLSMVRRVLAEGIASTPDDCLFSMARIESGFSLPGDALAVVRGSLDSAENGYLTGFVLDMGDRLSSLQQELKSKSRRRLRRLAVDGRLYFVPVRERDLKEDGYKKALTAGLERVPPAEEDAAAPAGEKEAPKPEAGPSSRERYYFIPVVRVNSAKSVK